MNFILSKGSTDPWEGQTEEFTPNSTETEGGYMHIT